MTSTATAKEKGTINGVAVDAPHGAINDKDIPRGQDGSVLVDGKTADGRKYHKQVWIETKSELEVSWDGLRYKIPAGKTKVEAGAFTSHLGGKCDAALAHVIAQQALKKFGTVMIDGKLSSLCHYITDPAVLVDSKNDIQPRIETVDGLSKKPIKDPTNPQPAVESHITIPANFETVLPPLVTKPAPTVSGTANNPAPPTAPPSKPADIERARLAAEAAAKTVKTDDERARAEADARADARGDRR